MINSLQRSLSLEDQSPIHLTHTMLNPILMQTGALLERILLSVGSFSKTYNNTSHLVPSKHSNSVCRIKDSIL